MRVHLASDHAGFDLKAVLVTELTSDGHDVVDHGATSFEPLDDYPSFCFAAAEAVAAEPGALGIVIGGSGNGEQIAANKVRGIRAALIHNDATATAAREHNNAQVAGIGARMHSQDEAVALVRLFLATPFSGDERHARRIAQVEAYDSDRA